MKLRKWDELPSGIRIEEVRPYYIRLCRKPGSLRMKRLFDVVGSSVLLILSMPAFLAVAVAIKRDSKGPVFFRQDRVTQYGRIFRIYKFRTMADGAQHTGAQLTRKNDMRITKVGKALRKYRIDELPQLLNILAGDMTFVGTRPEVPRYVKKYRPWMRAVLLLPAGVTSKASIHFKDEGQLLEQAEDIDRAYVEQILPEKMRYNLEALMDFGLWQDLKTLAQTVVEVMRG